ncbi:spore germination protein [Psychrobacillus vulpis]|uniref:Spore germination protein n=1 Tax=Psychrobacillus vulpis TaxID=2325572 RepID=A0A544TNJ5_9BACI|nr:spore germination protein [Psychrobacillus vulpis]TQR19005.1 spore germination protein [Psychrobacillus vulpis]
MSFFRKSISNSPEPKDSSTTTETLYLHTELLENIKKIKEATGNSNDVVIREMQIGKSEKLLIAIIYTDGLADKTVITDFIMKSLELDIDISSDSISKKVSQSLKDYCLTVGDAKDITDFKTLYSAILNGESVILVDGHSVGISASTKHAKDRAVTEPTTESVIRGPREAFTETLRTNTALIRRKIKDPNLWIVSRIVGRVTQTDIAIMYISGIANDKIVEEVLSRVDRIDIDGILESGYIEEFIQDNSFTLFPTIYSTERPDVIAAELLEGRVAIFVDGTPIVLIVPALFTTFIQSAEDHYQRADVSSLIRILRYVGISIALLGPSLYISITTFHQEMLPTPMLISIASQREGVPFPAFVEALGMELAFEILREAGLRMPRTIGPAVSIVGTLVIGQAAVEAGIVSAAMVIVVSITAICSFLFPSYALSNAIRILRFPLMILAGMFGLFGVVIGMIALTLHLCSLRSFGVPYMSPLAPFIPSDQKDTILRFPRWAQLTRPRLINKKNATSGTFHKNTKKRK